MVRVRIADPHQHGIKPIARNNRGGSFLLRHNHRAALKDKLHPVGPNAQALAESECLTEPERGGGNIGVSQNGNDGRVGNGTILHAHEKTTGAPVCPDPNYHNCRRLGVTALFVNAILERSKKAAPSFSSRTWPGCSAANWGFSRR
jgi:hypothetical protein